MKQPSLSVRQSILLLTMAAGLPVSPEDGDIMRLSACGYIVPEGPTGAWRLSDQGAIRSAHMTGYSEVFDSKATQAVLDFLKRADLKAWAKNLPITGDKAKDIHKLRQSIGEYVAQGSRLSLSAWGDKPTSEDVCGLLSYALADVARSELVDWDAVYELFRGVEIHG